MTKRRPVPAALHAELSEYSSLLRALRTSDTLDLTSHLLQASSYRSQQAQSFVDDDISLADDEDAATNAPPPTEATSLNTTSEATSSSSRSRLAERSLQSHLAGQRRTRRKERDTWTRWPLLAGDVHVPEFGLIDEVELALRQALGLADGAEAPHTGKKDPEETGDPIPDSQNSPMFDGEDCHPVLSAPALQALTSDSAAFLTRMLALLTAHVPTAEKSMQNRLRPINWETVIDVACANGAISAKAAQSVRNRMSRLYTPSTSHAVQRVEHLRAMRHSLSEALHKYDGSLLAVPVRYRKEPEKPMKRKRGPYKKR